MKIISLKAAECRLPLPRPIRLGPVEIRTRDFVALRLETDTGLVGDALGYPRGTALVEAVERMAPHVVGTDMSLRRRTVEGFLQNHVNGRPSYVKAASLVDIALWDLAAKAARLPLHQLLGGSRERVPVMVVAGYYLDQRTIDDVCQEVGRLADQGFERIKVMILGNDLDFDRRFVGAAHAVAGERLCVDAHWAWRSVAEAFHTCRRLDDFGLRFIEDPFGPFQAPQTAELQRMLRTPLACGEDAPDANALLSLARDVPVLRADATTCGGITPAVAVIEAAGLMGRSVLPHVFLPVHAQLAGALPAIDAVEVIPDESGACPMFDLLRRKPTIEGGVLVIDQEPGAGFDLEWSTVERTAARTVSLEAAAA